jgi:dimethylhistidine N-methyltransferase
VRLAVNSPRLSIVAASQPDLDSDAFAQGVRAGLSAEPKRLEYRFFYDEEGSDLFEEICRQPEYTIPGDEREILATHGDSIIASCPPGIALMELGSGSAEKTTRLIEAALRQRDSLHYLPLDINPTVIRTSSAALLDQFPGLRITGIAGEYAQAMPLLLEAAPSPRLILWLGSNIGNLDRHEAGRFLGKIARFMTPQDRLLVGFDLRKDPKALEAAYDDAAGVTARFNLNLLRRVNRDLGGHFDIGNFEHSATYDRQRGKIDMWVVSKRDQTVVIDDLDLTVAFARGERVNTECCYKYDLAEIESVARGGGLTVRAQWQDPRQRFCSALLGPSQT